VLKLAQDLYGSHPSPFETRKGWERLTNLDNLKPGDIIRWNNALGGHSVFVVAVNGNEIIYADVDGGNYSSANGGRGGCIIRWNKRTDKEAVMRRGIDSTRSWSAQHSATQMRGLPGRTIHVKCPVDIEIYDELGSFIGRIVNGVVDDDFIIEAGVSLRVENGEKIIGLPGFGEFTIKIVGSDSGEMNISITDIDLGTFIVGETKIFQNIVLSEGAEFITTLSSADTIAEARIFTLENDKIVGEVLADGTIVEVGFGVITPTGITGIRNAVIAMFTFLLLSAALWGAYRG
jgi:hypothetical protein